MWTSLHGHDEYSVVGRGNDGGGHPLQRAQHAKAMGAKALGITNHGVVYGLVDHYFACKEVGIQPVLGIEAYYQPVYTKMPDKHDKKLLSGDELMLAEYAAEQYHLSLWVKNQVGYKNLMKMLSIASKDNFYYHPIFTDELLAEYHEGLILGTGCIGGYIPQHIIKGESALAHIKADFFYNLFKEDFYLEVMPHAHAGQEVVNRFLEVWYDIERWPIVMTEDAHYTHASDYQSYKLFRAIKNNVVNDAVVDYSKLFMHTEEEMLASWAELMGSEGYGQKYLNESQHIADECHVEFDSTIHLPKLPGIEDQKQALKDMALAGVIEKQKFYINGDGKKRILAEYKARLDYEVKTITSRDFTGYMLLKADMAREAKARGIYIQGRGSVCGSLLAYFLGLHVVDPLKYGLPFERFISEDRVDLPDIDTDVQDTRRDELIKYVCERYGGNAAQICTFGRLKAKSLCNGMTKVMGLENGDARRFAEAVSTYVEGLDDPVLSREDMLANPEFAYLEEQYQIVTHFLYMWNQIVSIGTHAAGVAIAVGNVHEKLAIVRVKDKKNEEVRYVTSYDGSDVQRIGMLKLDILGLDALSMLADAEKEAGVSYSQVLRDRQSEEVPTVYDDLDIIAPDVMELFAKRKTLGLFQLGRRRPMSQCQQLKPKDIIDIAIVSACNRPEPIHEGTFEALLAARKAGSAQLPAIFQEDIMERCRSAGLSWGQIAKVLKSLKKYTVNDPETEAIFVKGYIEKAFADEPGYLYTTTEEEKRQFIHQKSEEAHAQWQAMRHYLFNKGHAVAYAHVAARQAFLKKRYPFAFFLGLLMNETGTGKMVCTEEGCIELDEKKGERQVYEIDAVRHGIHLLLPHVNGTANYSKVSDRFRSYIQQGLIVLPSISHATANAIVEARGDTPYKSAKDYKDRCGLKMTTLENFGALEFNMVDYLLRSKQFVGTLLRETQTSL